MDHNLSTYLSRILSGLYVFILGNKRYKLVYPGVQTKYLAELYANEEFERSKYNDWINEEEVVYFLNEIGMWSPKGDETIKQLEKQMEDTKVELYNSLLLPNHIKSLRKKLEGIKNNYNRLFQARHYLDHITIHGYVNGLKNQFILAHSIYDENDQLVFPDMESVDYDLLNKISIKVAEDMIDVTLFRKIARSDIWRNYWGANKNNIFEKSVVDWTDEQKTLVIMSKMYDSAYDHPECPPDSAIEDDDMFDGWMIIQRRENEKHKEKVKNEQVLKDKKLADAKELFIPVRSKEEASAVYNLNNAEGQGIIKERNKVVMKAGSKGQQISESNLPDVKRDLMMQQTQLSKQRK